jgi:hypothetical protein
VDLAAFLAAVALQQAARRSRSAVRSGRTPARLPATRIAAPAAYAASDWALLEAFVGRLTRAERRFYRNRLLVPPGGWDDLPLTDREKQLRHRVRVKLLRLLEGR